MHSIQRAAAVAAVIGIIAGPKAAFAQTTPPAQPAAQPPAAAPVSEAETILQKVATTYGGAKSYQASCSYVMDYAGATSRATMEVKTKGPGKAYLRLAPILDKDTKPGSQVIPAALIVADGKTAYFENTPGKAYFKAALPKQPQGSPLMFFPVVPQSEAGSFTTQDEPGGGKSYVFEADTDSGVVRMFVDTATYHIRRIVKEQTLGPIKSTSTITVDKETFDANIDDKEFTYKPGRGLKEMPAPPGATAIFGPSDTATAAPTAH